MTTATEQNTEFSVKAPEVVVVPAEPARCEEGQKLHKQFTKAYNDHIKSTPNSDQSWHIVLGRSYIPYASHQFVCKICAEYDVWYMRGRK